MALPSWDDMVSGRDCPFCAARPERNEFSVKVADLSVSTLYLDRNQTYRGYCALIYKGHVTGLEQLPDAAYAAFTSDMRRAMMAVSKAMQPDHMNYAQLGNAIPHLHCHIIPRFKDDPRWRVATFGVDTPMKALPREEDYDAIVADIRRHLPSEA